MTFPVTRRRLLQASAALPALASPSAHSTLSETKLGTAGDPSASLIAGASAFALDLYAEIRRAATGNVFLSPYSITLALAMTFAGAREETARQMAETLRFGLENDDLHETLAALTADLVERGTAEDDPDEEITARALRIANALWGEQTFPFSEDYLALLDEHYGAGLQLADFVNAPEEAREEINAWVADQTEDRILDIVPQGAITPMTRLVLANAIYFYGAWQFPFDPANTADDAFRLLDGGTVTVPFMAQLESFAWAQGEGYQAIELPYAATGAAGRGFAFTVLLPDEGQFEAVEEHFTPALLEDTLASLAPTDVRLTLPAFEFEFALGLSDILRTMGITDAFDPERADFTGMVDGKPPRPLFISEVLHKAFIAVDEEGTEAAAATVVIMETTADEEAEPPIEVRIDRPFLFAIRDRETGALLFLGRVLDPSA